MLLLTQSSRHGVGPRDTHLGVPAGPCSRCKAPFHVLHSALVVQIRFLTIFVIGRVTRRHSRSLVSAGHASARRSATGHRSIRVDRMFLPAVSRNFRAADMSHIRFYKRSRYVNTKSAGEQTKRAKHLANPFLMRDRALRHWWCDP